MKIRVTVKIVCNIHPAASNLIFRYAAHEKYSASRGD